jgi:hypothetical protein
MRLRGAIRIGGIEWAMDSMCGIREARLHLVFGLVGGEDKQEGLRRIVIRTWIGTLIR